MHQLVPLILDGVQLLEFALDGGVQLGLFPLGLVNVLCASRQGPSFSDASSPWDRAGWMTRASMACSSSRRPWINFRSFARAVSSHRETGIGQGTFDELVRQDLKFGHRLVFKGDDAVRQGAVGGGLAVLAVVVRAEDRHVERNGEESVGGDEQIRRRKGPGLRGGDAVVEETSTRYGAVLMQADTREQPSNAT
jgi:hypothetical protein